MKKCVVLLASLALLLLMAACGKKDGADAVSPEPETLIQGELVPPEAVELPREPEDAPVPDPETQPEELSPPAEAWSGMQAVYQEILREIYEACENPEQSQYENGPSFALFDADRDGTEELIVQNTGGSMADMWVRIYGYDEASQAAYVELEEFPSLYYYDNGVIEAAWSHNQGMAGDTLWPYTVYQYSGETGRYERLAAVDGWDKNLSDVWSGVAFPDDADQDGDGFVYYVITQEGGYAPEYGEVMDNGDYASWREEYLQGAFPAGPDFRPLTMENISWQ